jgi:hypothetical protein
MASILPTNRYLSEIGEEYKEKLQALKNDCSGDIDDKLVLLEIEFLEKINEALNLNPTLDTRELFVSLSFTGVFMKMLLSAEEHRCYVRSRLEELYAAMGTDEGLNTPFVSDILRANQKPSPDTKPFSTLDH